MSDANIAFALVLFSAFLHAGWNSVVKAGRDRLMTLALVDGTAFVLCLALLPFVALPTAEVWGFIGVSIVLNSLYRLLLVRAYDTGDFGQVYPVVRGIPPVVVAIVSTFLLAEQLSSAGYLGVVVNLCWTYRSEPSTPPHPVHSACHGLRCRAIYCRLYCR